MSEHNGTAAAPPRVRENRFLRLAAWYQKAVDVVCVTALTLQVISIVIMVVGRYFFSYVPLGTETFALFCMVWFSLLSIGTSVRDDSHLKMEFVDMVLPKGAIKYFRVFATVMMMAFGALMLVKGASLVKLTSPTTMPGFAISKGWLFLSLPVGGFSIVLSGVAVIIETLRGDKQ